MQSQHEKFPAPSEGFVLTHFIVSRDVKRSAAFYRDVLGGEIRLEGEPTAVKLANGWIIINVGGGPTDDKPNVVLEPPRDPQQDELFLEPARGRYQESLRGVEATGRGVSYSPEATRAGNPLLHA